jgi:predicted Zn-dependent protease
VVANHGRFSLVRTTALLAAFGFTASPAAAYTPAISPQERYWEAQVGQQAYAAYAQRGEIVPRQSPLYSVLDPVANAVASVANRQYYAPFHFLLLNEAEPNALAMPGGYVYVTTALLSYLRTRDELAAVLCHEVNHDIHHDMYNVYQAAQRGLQPIAYERAAETNADRAGAYTCAKAGFNPWAMVWNMRLHGGMGQGQQVASDGDHPSDAQRIADLTALLRTDSATFGRFRDDVAASVPLTNASAYAQSNYPGGRTAPYPMQYQPQYPAQYPSQYPMQYQPQYPAQYPSQMGPYPPPPPPPPCYPGC